MAGSETLSLHQQAERLQGWRDGFQAVYVIATGVQSGFFDQFATHPEGLTAQELARHTACHAPYVAIWCASAYRYQLLDAVHGRYVLAPHVDSLLAGRAHPDSQAVVFLNAVREAGPRLVHHSDYMKSGEVGSHAEAYGTNPTRLDPPPNQEALQRRLLRGGGRGPGAGPDEAVPLRGGGLPGGRGAGLELSRNAREC